MQDVADDVQQDGGLIRRARAGDAEAFGELVRRYMRRAYFSALALVGSRADALDLSQEAFARACRARRSLDPERPFYAWLYQILRRLCFNFLRDRRHRRARLEAAGSWLADEAAGRAAPDPDRALEQRETQRRVAAAIERLPAREREVLALKEFEALTYREIAQLVGVPAGTVMAATGNAGSRCDQLIIRVRVGTLVSIAGPPRAVGRSGDRTGACGRALLGPPFPELRSWLR